MGDFMNGVKATFKLVDVDRKEAGVLFATLATVIIAILIGLGIAYIYVYYFM